MVPGAMVVVVSGEGCARHGPARPWHSISARILCLPWAGSTSKLHLGTVAVSPIETAKISLSSFLQ